MDFPSSGQALPPVSERGYRLPRAEINFLYVRSIFKQSPVCLKRTRVCYSLSLP